MSCDHKFLGSNRCAKCGATFDLLSEPQPTYTDDVVAVMRDTITALREKLARHERTLGLLSRLVAWDDAGGDVPVMGAESIGDILRDARELLREVGR